MNIFKAIGGTYNEVRLNPNVGTWSFLLHRLSGILLAFYLFMHLIVIATSPGNAGAFDSRLAAVQTRLFHLLEIGLVGVIFFHMLNGLRILVADFFYLTRQHQKLLWIVVIIFIIIMAYATAVMLPKVFHREVTEVARIVGGLR